MVSRVHESWLYIYTVKNEMCWAHKNFAYSTFFGGICDRRRFLWSVNAVCLHLSVVTKIYWKFVYKFLYKQTHVISQLCYNVLLFTNSWTMVQACTVKHLLQLEAVTPTHLQLSSSQHSAVQSLCRCACTWQITLLLWNFTRTFLCFPQFLLR